MLKKIFIAFVALVALVLVIGLALPSKYRVERSTTIHAPAEAVYASVANLKRWQDWAPWNAGKYPGNQWMFGGPEVGVGAVHSWSGEDVGTGTLSLTQADPKTGVAYDMSLEQGRYVMHGRISFEPADSGTRVTWVDEGDLGGNPLMHYLRFPLQSRLGRDLEQALAQLKKQVEASLLPVRPKPEPTPAPAEATAPAPVPTAAQPTAPPGEGAPSAEAVKPAPTPTASAPAPASESPPVTSETAAPTGEPKHGEAAPVGMD
jgi:hypothetical protein